MTEQHTVMVTYCVLQQKTIKNCKIHILRRGYIRRNGGSHPQIPTKREMMLDDFKESVKDAEVPAKGIAKFSETR